MPRPLSSPTQTHPLNLDGEAIVYHLRRSTRKTLGLRVDHQGLWVTAPLRLSIAAIEAGLLRSSSWILAKLALLRSAVPLPNASGAMLASPSSADLEQIHQQLNARVAYYAAQLGVVTPVVRLSKAKTRWGSCNHLGVIRLNWQLAKLSSELVDYVVAHEVAHLVEMNHSPRFWAVVERLYPDYRAARDRLRRWTIDPVPPGH
jgi:predicted metal-dependent hydrolase